MASKMMEADHGPLTLQLFSFKLSFTGEQLLYMHVMENEINRFLSRSHSLDYNKTSLF